ncbi:MAG TPA: VWA domain-containing protein [Phototrophicaceae bacterium]|nr:VWA domain-containing protein [Phototrophicaceae bacterium]
MTFTTPLALLLLLLVPIVVYIGWPRVRYRRGRDIASLILRAAIFALLVFALAGTQTVRAADKLAVVYLMDVSDSVSQPTQESELSYVQNSLASMGTDDEAAVVVFGGNALVERPMSSVRELDAIHSTPSKGNTNVEQALDLGLALFPADAAKRMVILSDGEQTIGDAEVAARRAAATGVQISYVQLPHEDGPEVTLSDVDVPASVNAGQSFDLSMTITAQEATAATITVFAGGDIIHREQQNLQQGVNHFTLPLQAGSTGFRDFRVQVDPANGSDTYFQNNQLSTFSQVVGPPRVLLVSTSDTDSQYLLKALQQEGMTVDQAQPDSLPDGVAALATYNSVILDDVPATALSPQRMSAIQSYVRDLGGGLVAVGGPDAYGPGGYYETPLEETLPVDMQIKDQKRLPQLTLVYVIDTSGSMSETDPDGVQKIELAKEAIIRSLDLLQPTDRAGVLSFDTGGYWIAQVQPVLDKSTIESNVATLRASGGTDILAGMQLASDAMKQETSQRKHIILMTDGIADANGLVALTTDLNQNYNVTTSTIAIGQDAETSLLQNMAKAGGGNYHATDSVNTIPTIFAQETVLATRSYIIEKQFVPTLTAVSPIMSGITSAPPLLGYVATTPKQTAQVILRTGDSFNDPILASWQYGLGRSVAFMSDATARWSSNWVSWSQFAQFWSQAVRWTIQQNADNNVEAQVVMDGDQAHLLVDARDANGNFLNGLNLHSSLVAPASGGTTTATTLQLQQVAPGQYEATFDPSSEGAYFMRLGDDTGAVNQITGWVMSYSAEYQPATASVLPDIAHLTNGTDLSDDPGSAFTHDLLAQASLTPIAPLLLLLALCLLPFDIAVRRLLVTRSDLERARSAVLTRSVVVTQEPSERLSSLMGAKARAQQQINEQGSTVSALRSRRAERQSAQPTSAETPSAPPVDQPHYTPPAPSAPAPKPEEGSNIAGQLLKRRKEREQ